jgi:hypothetical protein
VIPLRALAEHRSVWRAAERRGLDGGNRGRPKPNIRVTRGKVAPDSPKRTDRFVGVTSVELDVPLTAGFAFPIRALEHFSSDVSASARRPQAVRTAEPFHRRECGLMMLDANVVAVSPSSVDDIINVNIL